MFLIASCTVYKEEEFVSPDQHRYHAVAEEPVDAETRVYADSKLRVRWNEGDHISIFERNTYNQEFEFLGDTGDTAGDFDPLESSGYHSSGDIEDGHVYAVYPYDKKNKCDYEGKLTVTFPSTQHYKKDSFGVGANVMVAKTNTLDLRFMHVGGYRTFKLYGEGVSVSSVKIESNGPEYLAGRTDVVIGEDGTPTVSFIESSSNSKSVELVCDTPITLGATASDAIEFWFVLPPGTLSQGFTVTVTDENGNEFTKSTSNSIEIKSGVKKSMPAFEVEMGNEPTVPVPEAIDLGLPSGLKWASFNVGATKPEEYGDYFAWGEIAPKDSYSWDNYLLGGMYSLSKYNTDSTYGTVDNKISLEEPDDVASVNYGGYWRMPSFNECMELRDNCTWTWTSNYNETGVAGMIVTSNKAGYSDKSIFLPTTGRKIGSSDFNKGSRGYFWSSSLNTNSTIGAWYFYFGSNIVDGGSEYRYPGFSVRPVYDDRTHPTSVELDKSSLSLFVGDSEQLVATISPADATVKTVTWTSSDESVATVSNSGVVTGVTVGSAIITVTTTDGGKTATCNVTVSMPGVPEAIDLGLPSGLKWASFNLGATAPEEYGDYFAWGEIEPKDSYNWSTYIYATTRQYGGFESLLKYNTDSSLGAVDNLTTLEMDDDAAHVILGAQWRIPTLEEAQELINNCDFVNTTLNGVDGYLVTSRINGNSIFLPTAQYWESTFAEGDSGCGRYWLSSLYSGYTANSKYAYRLSLRPSSHENYRDWDWFERYAGLSIRPVYGAK